jgi:hypothetical protein
MSLLAAFTLASCGGGGGGNGVATLSHDSSESSKSHSNNKTPTSDQVDEAFRKFAQCMREHGVPMQDPRTSGRGGQVSLGLLGKAPADKAKVDAAQKACDHFISGVVRGGPSKRDPQQEARMREQALAFAKCMRQHGVNMPDPQFQSGGRVEQRVDAKPDDPNFKRANQACAKKVGMHGGLYVSGGKQ